VSATGERGAVAGAEALAVVVVVLFGGMVLSLNAWAVIDPRTALDSAARDYLRTYTTSSDPVEAVVLGRSSAGRVLAARGVDPTEVRFDDPDPRTFGPCSVATLTLRATVRSAPLPFGVRVGSREVRVTHVELIDPHREMTPGPDHDRGRTPCAE